MGMEYLPFLYLIGKCVLAHLLYFTKDIMIMFTVETVRSGHSYDEQSLRSG